MGKPRLIILIRHAQSEGNKNRDIHQTTPDHRVNLTPEGWKQAEEAGRKLRSLLRPDDTLHFYTSPYRRTRETTEGILASLTSSHPSPSPFPRQTIKVYEEPRLREQDFGNFQPCSAEMARMWQERANYGHFFYRIPNGESAADAYDRVSGFNESLWRSFGEDDFASVCVLVTHGLMTRVFLMKWYHFSVEYFEDLRNMNHCEFVVMKRSQENGKYVLQNQLRTWSELREEREAAAEKKAEEDRAAEGGKSPIPVRKKWEGLHDGHDHSIPNLTRRQARRQNTADLFNDEGVSVAHEHALQHGGSTKRKKGSGLKESNQTTTTFPPQDEDDDDDDDDARGRVGPPKALNEEPGIPHGSNAIASAAQQVAANATAEHPKTVHLPTHIKMRPYPHAKKSHVVSPSRLDFLRQGRDGGGSESGVASTSGSDDEDCDDDDAEPFSSCDDKPAAVAQRRSKAQQQQPRSMAMALNHDFDENGVVTATTTRKRGGSGEVRADALGDQSDADEGIEGLEAAEKWDRSVEGSVL